MLRIRTTSPLIGASGLHDYCLLIYKYTYSVPEKTSYLIAYCCEGHDTSLHGCERRTKKAVVSYYWYNDYEVCL